jgi:hypothetical protein
MTAPDGTPDVVPIVPWVMIVILESTTRRVDMRCLVGGRIA